MSKSNFTLFQLVIVFIILVSLILLIGPMIQNLMKNARRTASFRNLKNVVIAMQDYASADVQFNQMPYPVVFDSSKPLPKWGETKECWSPDIIKLLFKNKQLVKGNEGILLTSGIVGSGYKSMLLSEDLEAVGDHEKMRWKINAKLQHHVYCEPGLTNAASGNIIMGITYDQPDINNCVHQGKGWLIFFMDGSGGYKKRRYYGEYDFKDKIKKIVPVIAHYVALKKIKKHDAKATLRKVFGVNGNGGSTEIIGRKSDSVFYKSFVEE
ncbi:MAG: hypothetical protein COA79_05135 [Planctomycetota bacterium]|nr:MAG: hypothetical protein COA79_05135 [Planctomycetota bacterium]